MKILSDADLETAIQNCVDQERKLVTDLLHYLLELETRKLYLSRGYNSLFDYCRRKLQYSEAEAMLRISAMRLLKQAPEAAEKISQGELSLTVAAQVHQAARRNNLKAEATQSLVEECTGVSKREAEEKLAKHFPEAPKPERARPLSATEVEIRFTVSIDEAALFEELLNQQSHSNFNRSYAKLFVALAHKAQKKSETRKTAPPPRPAAVKQGPRRSRKVPKKTERAVWKRDDGACQYRDPATGNRCLARHGVQMDHIIRFCDGGSHDLENLRLYCGAHNRARESER